MTSQRRKDIIIYANRASASAAILGRSLNCRRWLVERPRLNGGSIRADRLVVNWGTTEIPGWFNRGGRLLNPYDRIQQSISKVQSHHAFVAAGVPTLELTIDPVQVRGWLTEGHSVLARRDGLASGRGIRILNGAMPQEGEHEGRWDFYTRYFPKTHEYRVHVWAPRSLRIASERATVRGDGVLVPEVHSDNQAPREEGIDSSAAQGGSFGGGDGGAGVHQNAVIDITQKKRSQGGEGEESGVAGEGQLRSNRTLYQRVVRSHANGWVHAHENIHLPGEARDTISDAACGAVSALGLDFGAVDILARFSKKHPDRLKAIAVCEVNTAPGLENTVTIEAYTKAIQEYSSGTSTR